MASDNVRGVFERGETFYGPNRTIDTADYGLSIGLEGVEAIFRDVGAGQGYGVKVPDSQNEVHAVCVRNVSGFTLLPGYAVVWDTGGFRGKRVDGKSSTTAQEIAGIVDDQLPAAGVRNGDLFWLIVKGPVLAKTSLAGDAENVITEGDIMYALTGATTNATTSGRLQSAAIDSATTWAGDILLNHIGRAMAAATTANTNSNIKVYLRPDY